MSTNRTRIERKARTNPGLVFTSLYHHIADIDNLRECFHLLKGNKAVGVDDVTKAEYAKDLEANLEDLSARLKRMGYRPQPKRRSYIPKPGSEKGRPLGISSFEDKIVELAAKRGLEPIFESIFEDCSYGYRPGRSPHDCVDELGRTIQQRRVNYIVEADIRGFFDHVNHEWLLKFLQQRIGDRRVLRLITRMLRAGIMEDGLVHPGEEGTPQGSILSPPTKVQTFSLSRGFLRKKGEVNTVNNANLIRLDNNPCNQCSENLASSIPIGLVQVGFDRLRKILQAGQCFS